MSPASFTPLSYTWIDLPVMSDAPKKMVVGSMIVAGLLAVLAICDLILGVPFSGVTGTEYTRLMDILFIVSSAILGYLAYDAYRDLR